MGISENRDDIVRHYECEQCHHLKIIDSVSSPTFSLVNEYINCDGNSRK